MERLSIGKLARQAGVKISTIRVYERHDLLPEPARSAAGYREYETADLDRLVFIRRAKELGFTLSEIRELLALFDAPDTGCADVLAQAEEKLADIDARLRDLRKMKRSLTDLTKACTGQGPSSGCPIFQALERKDDGR